MSNVLTVTYKRTICYVSCYIAFVFLLQMSERSVTVFSNSRCPSPVAPDPFALSNSLEATLKHPTSVNPDLIETIADLKNNPRVLQTPPYNENGALHWVDKNNELLYMTFPGRLELYGKYNKTGPYFSLMENQVSLFSSFIFTSQRYIRRRLFLHWENSRLSFN